MIKNSFTDCNKTFDLVLINDSVSFFLLRWFSKILHPSTPDPQKPTEAPPAVTKFAHLLSFHLFGFQLLHTGSV